MLIFGQSTAVGDRGFRLREPISSAGTNAEPFLEVNSLGGDLPLVRQFFTTI